MMQRSAAPLKGWPHDRLRSRCRWRRTVSPRTALTTASRASPRTPRRLTVGELLAAQRRDLFTGGFTTPVLALSAERLTTSN